MIQKLFSEREPYESAIQSQPGLSPIYWAYIIDVTVFHSFLRVHNFGKNHPVPNTLIETIIDTHVRTIGTVSNQLFL